MTRKKDLKRVFAEAIAHNFSDESMLAVQRAITLYGLDDIKREDDTNDRVDGFYWRLRHVITNIGSSYWSHAFESLMSLSIYLVEYVLKDAKSQVGISPAPAEIEPDEYGRMFRQQAMLGNLHFSLYQEALLHRMLRQAMGALSGLQQVSGYPGTAEGFTPGSTQGQYQHMVRCVANDIFAALTGRDLDPVDEGEDIKTPTEIRKETPDFNRTWDGHSAKVEEKPDELFRELLDD